MRLCHVIPFALLSLASVNSDGIVVKYGKSSEALNVLNSIASTQSTNDAEPMGFISQQEDLRKQPEFQATEPVYKIACDTSAYFDAEIYPLDPADPHPRIAWAAPQLEAMFTGQPYPGDYTLDHPDGLRVVRADYDTLPEAFRKWVESQHEQKKVCVVDGVAFFAPAVILETLGLLAGEGKGDCKGRFPTDPMAYYGSYQEDVLFITELLGNSELGDKLQVHASATMLVKEGTNAENWRDELE